METLRSLLKTAVDANQSHESESLTIGKDPRPGPLFGPRPGPLLEAKAVEADPQQASIEVIYRCLTDVQAESVNWLWPDRIAKKKLTLVAGDPGLGKSQISLGFTATVSNGGTWPDESKCNKSGNVILLTSEDDAGDTIKPRLEAYGADMSRIFILEAIRNTDIKGHEQKRGFNLQEDLGRLGAMIDKIGGADLVTIDPISAYVGNADSYKNSDVRALLAPLSELASKHECAVLAVSHLAKSGSSAMNKISGSLGFIAAVRAGYLIVKDPNDKDKRLFLPVKNNIGIDSTGFSYRIESITLPSGIETSRVAWEPGVVTITADEALTAQCANPEERSQLDDAKEFLSDLLQLGPVESNKVSSEARKAGVSERTLHRAKTALGVKSKKGFISGKWVWNLPNDKEPFPSREMQNGESAQGSQVGIHGNVGNVGNVVCQELDKNNINNNISRIPSKGVIQHCQHGQHCQESHVGQDGQELGYVDF